MHCYLVRHGRAEDHAFGRDDFDRALTEEGVARFRRQVDRLAECGVRLDAVYTSPLVRAVQTAELLTPVLDGEIVKTEALATSPRPALLDEVTGEFVALVGHEPWMSQTLGWLVHSDPAAGGRVRFKKGSVAWLEGPLRPGAMVLRAFLPSRFLL